MVSPEQLIGFLFLHTFAFVIDEQAEFGTAFNMEEGCIMQYVEMGTSLPGPIKACGTTRPDAEHALVTDGKILIIRFYSNNIQHYYTVKVTVTGEQTQTISLQKKRIKQVTHGHYTMKVTISGQQHRTTL